MVHYLDSRRSAESAYESRANLFDYADEVDITLVGTLINPKQVLMLVFEARGEFLGNPDFHEYSLFFEPGREIIHFEFNGSIDAGANAILGIQNSIELMD